MRRRRAPLIAPAIANPNIGFVCQLLQWGKRMGNLRRAAAATVAPAAEDDDGADGAAAAGRRDSAEGPAGHEAIRVFRMAPHSPHDPANIVPKLVQQSSVACPPPAAASASGEEQATAPGREPEEGVARVDMSVVDPRFAFVIQIREEEGAPPGDAGPAAAPEGRAPPRGSRAASGVRQFVWIGGACDGGIGRLAEAAARAFERYERCERHRTVAEGQEDEAFRVLLRWDAGAVRERAAYTEDAVLMRRAYANRTRRPPPRNVGELGGEVGGGAGAGEAGDADAAAPPGKIGSLTRTCSAPMATASTPPTPPPS